MAEDNQQEDLKQTLETFREQQKIILEQQKVLLEQIAESSRRSKKDLWDRLSSIAPILSGTIIAIGGTFFTLSYNQQQLKLQEAQTIERFIPHLLGDEKSKRAAILAISSLTDNKLAAKVASIFASPGTASALESIAENDTSNDKKDLKSALARTLDNMAGNFIVEKRYDDAIDTSRRALSLQEQSFGSSSPELVPNLNRIAELYTIHKDFNGAETSLTRSADIQKAAFGVESMQYAAQLRRLSSLYKEQGLDGKSQSIMNQAIAIEQKVPATGNSGSSNVAVQNHADGSAEHVSAATGTSFSQDRNAHAAIDGAAEAHSSPASPNNDSNVKTSSDFGSSKTNLSDRDRFAQPEAHGQELAPKSQDTELETPKQHESISSQPNRIE